MTSGFRFGFQTDDIDIDVDEDMSDAGDAHAHVQQDEVESQGRSTAPFETKSHSIEELVCLYYPLFLVPFAFHVGFFLLV